MNPSARRKAGAKATVDRTVRDALDAAPCPDTRSAFERLLRQVRRSALLRTAPQVGGSSVAGHGEVVAGLLALADFHADWLRPVEAWEPAGSNPLPQFASLARHLLAAYPVPAFLTSVWLRGRTAEARRQQGWFVHVGAGRNLRTADLPLPYTRMMAHHALQAPDHLTVEQALRWGQVRGLGGSKALANAVAATRLGRSFEGEDFWATVLHFLVNHPDLDVARVGPIVEYLYDQRFVPVEQFDTVTGPVESRPPQPNLSMKGRKPRSFLRRVRDWEDRLGSSEAHSVQCWPRCDIGPFRLAEEATSDRPARVWAIRELLSSRALWAEGRAMHHCVATYAGRCLRSRSTIWSMTVQDRDGLRRVLTVEVDPSAREVVQARRCFNRPPYPKDREVLNLWADREGLTVVC
jgi:hypothetical protein